MPFFVHLTCATEAGAIWSTHEGLGGFCFHHRTVSNSCADVDQGKTREGGGISNPNTGKFYYNSDEKKTKMSGLSVMMLHLVFWDNDALRFPKFWFLFMVMVMVHYHPFGQKEISNIEEALWWLCLRLFEQNWVSSIFCEVHHLGFLLIKSVWWVEKEALAICLIRTQLLSRWLTRALLLIQSRPEIHPIYAFDAGKTQAEVSSLCNLLLTWHA